jgi:CheY-like chemotaxis protein
MPERRVARNVPLETTTVLVVDDEAAIREMYADMLERLVDEVVTAADGATALSLLDGSVDVVLLDRRMPGQSGDEVLEAIRESDHECRVAMLTAVEPDEDIATMRFDTYLTKPVTIEELRDVVRRLLALDDYETAMEERFRVAQKIGALETAKTEGELADSDAYADLRSRYRELTEEMEEAGERVDSELVRGVIEPEPPAGG